MRRLNDFLYACRFSCKIVILVFLIYPCAAIVFADTGEFTNEEILFQEIPGTITKVAQKQAPVSVTVVTAQDIAITPAKNLLDLIEIYVPGALYMNHSEGLQLGIRGIISDRRNKFLVLVNGKNMGVRGHNGNDTEMEDWDLGDIEKIEIIRGSGSVTYGPGAISGVIRITTKTGKTDPGVHVAETWASGYNSYDTRLSYGVVQEKYNLYLYSSVADTAGEKPRAYLVTSNGRFGYWGEGQAGTTPNYFKDSNSDPHMKYLADLSFMEEWRLWARYTQDGMPTTGFGSTRLTLDGLETDREAKENKQATLVLENEHVFNQDKEITLKSKASLMSTDTQSFVANSFSADLSNGSNYNWNYSEDQSYLETILSMKLNEAYSGALGGSYEHEHWGAGWDDDPKDFRMGDRKSIISGSDSNVVPGLAGETPVYVGEGWSSETYSTFGELNMSFNPKLNLLGSFRFDKNSYSKWLFSPRAAIFSDWDKFGTTKLIAQQSLRMSTSEQLLSEDKAGTKPAHETLQGLEFIYSPKPLGNWTPSLSIFYNELQVLSWNKTLNNTALTGEGSLYGAEFENTYTKDNFVFGINHSFVDLVKWNLGQTADAGGFSYADLKLIKNGIYMRGTGDSINNWSKNTTKIFSTLKLMNDRLTLHANAQMYWGFEGVKDQLKVIENADAGTSFQNQASTIIDDVRSRNAGDAELRVNIAVGYQIKKSLSATVYVMNLIKTNGGKRYYYDSGSLGAPYPTRISWVEEPTVIGVRFDYNF